MSEAMVQRGRLVQRGPLAKQRTSGNPRSLRKGEDRAGVVEAMSPRPFQRNIFGAGAWGPSPPCKTPKECVRGEVLAPKSGPSFTQAPASLGGASQPAHF